MLASIGDRAWRARRHALLVLVLASLALAGCGSDDGSQVRDTLARLARATAAKDYRTLCEQVLSAHLLERINQIGLPCERALAKGLGQVREPRLVVGKTTISGSTALAKVHSSAANQGSSDDTVQLVKENGHWRVSSLVGSAATAPATAKTG